MKKLELIILLSINILFGSRKYGGLKLKKNDWKHLFLIEVISLHMEYLGAKTKVS